MLATIINCALILAGSCLGLLLKGKLPERFLTVLIQAIGLCVISIGISSAVSTENTLCVVVCLVVGTLIGQAIDIERRLDSWGDKLRRRFEKNSSGGGSTFTQGFVTASLLFCVGAMSIVGALENGLTGNFDTLKAKSVLDGISSIIFASSLGVGVALSAVPVLLYQGLISLAAGVLSPLLGDAVIAEMTCVGSLLIVAMGLNMLGVTKIKVMNLVPGIFLPILLCRIL